MPTPLPGLKRVPRWRTMISPPVTCWPAKTFTPRRLALESRPLRDEPRPFLCAISRSAPDLLHADARELLTVALAALVAALGLVLEDADLRATLVADDRRGDLGAAEALAELGVAVAGDEQWLELDRGALVALEALHEQGLPLGDAVLLAAGLDHGVGGGVGHVGRQSVVSVTSVASASAFARERRRPPLRPRRRGLESRASSSPSSSGSAASSSTSSAAAAGFGLALRLRAAGFFFAAGFSSPSDSVSPAGPVDALTSASDSSGDAA